MLLFHYYIILPYCMRLREHTKFASLLHCRLAYMYYILYTVSREGWERKNGEIGQTKFRVAGSFFSWLSEQLIVCIFPRPCGPRKTTMQLLKCLHILSLKTSNMVYVLSNWSKYHPNISTNIQQYCTVICTVKNLFAVQVSACMQNCRTLPLSLINFLITAVG